MLATVNVALCQMTRSIDIQKEVDAIRAIHRARMQNEAEQLEAYAQNRVIDVTEHYLNIILIVKAQITSYILSILTTSEFDKYLAIFKAQLNLDNFNVDVNQTMKTWEKNLVKSFQNEIDDMKKAIDGNPKNYQCWKENKDEFREIFKTFERNVNISVFEEKKFLDTKLTALAETVKNETIAMLKTFNIGKVLLECMKNVK